MRSHSQIILWKCQRISTNANGIGSIISVVLALQMSMNSSRKKLWASNIFSPKWSIDLITSAVVPASHIEMWALPTWFASWSLYVYRCRNVLSCDQRAKQENATPAENLGRHVHEGRLEGTKDLCRRPALGAKTSDEMRVTDLYTRPLRGNGSYIWAEEIPWVHASCLSSPGNKTRTNDWTLQRFIF